MHLLIRLTLEGTKQNAVLAPADAVLLACTHDAGFYIQQLAREAGGQCAQCGLLCRSTELSGGRCNQQTGCGIDQSWAKVCRSPDWMKPAITELYGTAAIVKFAEQVVANAPDLPAPTTQPDDYSDLFDSFFGLGGS